MLFSVLTSHLGEISNFPTLEQTIEGCKDSLS